MWSVLEVLGGIDLSRGLYQVVDGLSAKRADQVDEQLDDENNQDKRGHDGRVGAALWLVILVRCLVFVSVLVWKFGFLLESVMRDVTSLREHLMCRPRELESWRGTPPPLVIPSHHSASICSLLSGGGHFTITTTPSLTLK